MGRTRQLKYGNLIQKDLSEIFQRDSHHLFGKAFITVTEVRVSPDLGFAKAYISLMMVDNPGEFIEMMNKKKTEIRRTLGLNIGKQVRIVPDLLFLLDSTQEEAQRMDDLISGLNIPPEKEAT